MLVVGGEEDVAEACQFMWRKLSPDIKIHKVTALEAEIVKLIENSYGALKVTFANTFLSLAEKSNTSFVRLHQAWNSDLEQTVCTLEPFHMIEDGCLSVGIKMFLHLLGTPRV